VTRRTGARGVLLGGVLILAVAGCTDAPTAPVSGHATSPATSAGATSAPVASPSRSASSTPPASSTQVTNDYTPPPRTPGVPDPSVAGQLTANSFPDPVLGFTGKAVRPQEGEYNPNGTWVHAKDGTQAAYESVPQCAAISFSKIPTPRSALAATYLGEHERPGNGLALEFSDSTKAKAFFTLYARQLKGCPHTGDAELVVGDLDVGSATIVSRRTYSGSQMWSEMIKVSGRIVMLIIIADDHHSSLASLRSTAQALLP